MRSLRTLALGMFAALALTACASGGGGPINVGGPVGVQEANTVAQAEIAYTQAAHGETLWLQSGKATPAQAKVAKALEGAVYANVVTGREAVAANDSPTAKIALQLFNQALAAFTGYLAKNGASL